MEHIIHFIKDLKQTGAIAPSSKFLAKDLVEQLEDDISCQECQPLNILEIGPGTGPLTKQITKLLRPKDNLDIVELHEHFFKTIQQKYQRQNICVHHQDILNFNSDNKYDYIFSSLPYEAMSEELIREIWRTKLNLCKQKAFICYFKYVSFRKFKSNFEKEIVQRYQRDKKVVLLNLPPAKVFTLQINNPSVGASSLIDNVA